MATARLLPAEEPDGRDAGDEAEWEADYYTLSPEKTPKEIDLYTDFYTRDKKHYPGIYAIEGDTLKICFDKAGKGRPAKFKTGPARPGEMLLVLKRITRPAADGGAWDAAVGRTPRPPALDARHQDGANLRTAATNADILGIGGARIANPRHAPRHPAAAGVVNRSHPADRPPVGTAPTPARHPRPATTNTGPA